MATVCHYCNKPLPESGCSHYALVQSRLGDVVPACIACTKYMKAQVVDLRKGEP